MQFNPSKIIPTGNTILCTLENPDSEEFCNDSGFVYKKYDKNVPEYKIISMHFLTEDDRINFKFNIGDIVYTASTGTEAIVNGVKYFLFKPEHIAFKKV